MSLHLALVQFYWYDQLPARSTLLAKAKSHTHSHIRGISLKWWVCFTHKEQESLHELYLHSLEESISLKCALHTRQESLLELYLLLQSLKEAIHSKCNLKVHYGTFSHLPLTYWVHVKFHRKKSVSGYTDYTKAYHNFYWKPGFSGSVPSHLHSI